MGSTSSGAYSVAIGRNSAASERYTLAFGEQDTASGIYSIATGLQSKAFGANSVAIGELSKASGSRSTAMGYNNKAVGDFSTALGNYLLASGNSSTAIGFADTARGYCSITLGFGTKANGNITTTMGYYTIAPSYNETAVGSFNTNYTPASTSFWNASDRLFVIGNGTSDAARSNAMTVLKNGCVGLQTVTSPAYALDLPNSSTITIGSARAYAWTTYSDSRLKEDQTPLTYGLKELMELLPMQYIHHSSMDQSAWAKEHIPRTIGLIAQEVYKIIPEAVDVPENSLTGLWGLNYDKLIPVLVKGIQEQQQKISSQQLLIESAKRENQQLKSELNELKSLVNSLIANQTAQLNK